MAREVGLPLRFHLILFGLICFIPALVAVGYVGIGLSRNEQLRVEQKARTTVEDFSRDVESQIDSMTEALYALATSPALASGDFARFREQAVVVAKRNNANIALRTLDGQHIVNTLLPFGTEPMPVTKDPILLDADRRALTTGAPVVSDLYIGVSGKRPYVSIDLPVRIDGQFRYLLSLALTAEQVTEGLRVNELGRQDWLAVVVGTDGRVIARTRDLDRFVGMPATGDLARHIKQKPEGTLRSTTLDGVPVFTAFRVGKYGWTTIVSVPEAVLGAPVRSLTLFLAIVVGTAILATLVGASAYSRLLGGELEALAENARRVGSHASLRPFSGKIAEVVTAQRAFAEASAKAEALLREIDHRVKNTLSVVQALASRTIKEPDQRRALSGRIGALNAAHEALSAGRWSDVPMADLLSSVCEAHDLTVAIEGPAVQLTPRTATCLAQVWHELAANARQHGAFSSAGGRVEASWKVREGRVQFDWNETPGPSNGMFQRGFGLQIVDLCVVRQLDGKLTIAAEPEAWRVSFTFPLTSDLGHAAKIADEAGLAS